MVGKYIKIVYDRKGKVHDDNKESGDGDRMDGKKVVRMSVSELLPGTMTAKEIYTSDDRLLIPNHSVITAKDIARFALFDIQYVSVYADAEIIRKIEEEKDDFEQFHFTPQEEKEFTEFKKSYDLSIHSIEENMNQLLMADDDIDSGKLIDEVDTLIYKSRSRYHIFDMLHCIKSFDDETYRHSLNVAMINNIFAGWLKMNEDEKKLLTLCGLLHDVGKLQINRDVLRKPSSLTEEEFEEIKQHPLRGYESLKDKKIPECVKRVSLLHHERCDGKGYPFGFKTDEIDPYAAITAIADVYEAMTATRVYRKGMSPFDVIRIFEEEGKKQFHPAFLVPLLYNLTNTYLQHEVVLSNGKKGKIVLIDSHELSRPMILLENGKFLNLKEKREITITEVR